MLTNKYSKWYFELINTRKYYIRSKKDGNYYEIHHIIPVSLGGDNKKQNKITLTPREHFIAHLLLTKMYEGEIKYKMCWALHRLANSTNKENKFNSSQYDLARNIHSKSLRRPKSESTKEKMRKPKSPEHREKIAENNRKMWATRDRSVSDDIRLKRLDARAKKFPNGTFFGKSHTDETKEKIRQSVLGVNFKPNEDQIEKHLLAVRANAEKQKGVNREGQALKNIQEAQKLRWINYYLEKERLQNA